MRRKPRNIGKRDAITRRRFLGLSAAALGGALTGLRWADQPGYGQPIVEQRDEREMQIKRVDTAELIGLESEEARIAFDRATGRLVSLRNNIVQDEYLKEFQEAGNPFRVYTDFVRPFELADDPADIARTALDPFCCRLVSAACEQRQGGQAVVLIYRDRAEKWELRLEVALAAGGSSEWNLQVTNVGTEAGQVIVEFPYLDRVCLGASRRKNLATVLEQAGYIAPSYHHPGGIHGNGGEWSMQWHCVYDPDSGGALGLIVKDSEVRNKQLRADSPSLRISTFPEQEVKPGDGLALPPVQLLVYRGDWRATARAYRAWFAVAMQPVAPAEWLRRCDGWAGRWFGKRGGAAMGGSTQMDSFRDLPNAYLDSPIDNQEYAFHDRGCQFPVSPPGVTPLHYIHTTGDNILREDLGGAEALREGVAAVHALGFHFTFYVEGYIVHETSELAQDGRAQRWSVMHKNGTISGNYTREGFFHMCPACEEWQDHLASVCARLLRETGADGVRLDSLGFYFLPCYNPAHNHPHPFVYNDGVRRLLAKVSKAVREANPNAVLTTEGAVDFYARYMNGALTSVCSRQAPPMRMALPNYRCYVYGALGPVWESLSGYAGGGDVNWRCVRFPIEETFIWGEVEEDPEAPESRVICRLFRSEDHWALVGAWVDSDEPWLLPRGLDGQPTLGLDPNAGPVQVRVRGLAPLVESAVGFDLETGSVRPVAVERSGDDLLLSLDWRWFVVVLRRKGCRPLVSFGDPPAVAPGATLTLDLRLVAPAEGAPDASATVHAPGLDVQETVRVPGSFDLPVPARAKPGLYLLTLDGPGVLGHKRFLKVEET